MPVVVDDTMTTMSTPASAGWTTAQKALLFAVIIGFVAFYVRWTKQRSEREGQGYEKSMA